MRLRYILGSIRSEIGIAPEMTLFSSVSFSSSLCSSSFYPSPFFSSAFFPPLGSLLSTGKGNARTVGCPLLCPKQRGRLGKLDVLCVQTFGNPFEQGRSGMSRFASKRSGRIVKKLMVLQNEENALSKEINFVLKLPLRFQSEILQELMHAEQCILAYKISMAMHSKVPVTFRSLRLQSNLVAILEKKGFCDQSLQVLSLLAPYLAQTSDVKDEQDESDSDVREGKSKASCSDPSRRAHVFNSLIESYANLGLWAKSLSYFKEFEQSGVFVEKESVSLAYQSLAKAYCKAKKPRKALKLLDEAADKEVSVNQQTRIMVVDALSRMGDVTSMNEVMGWIPNACHHVDIKVANSLLRMHVKQQQLNDALELLREISSKGIPFDHQTYNLLKDAIENCSPAKEEPNHSELSRPVNHGDCPTTSCWTLDALKASFQVGDESADPLLDFICTMDLPQSMARFEESEWSIDLHGLHIKTARFVLLKWMTEVGLKLESDAPSLRRLPIISIITGWGKHSEKQGKSLMKSSVVQWLEEMQAPFKESRSNHGILVAQHDSIKSWMVRKGGPASIC